MRKSQEQKGTVSDAISFGWEELQSLAEEIREVVDDASGTPRENTQRIQTLDETASTLEGMDEPDVDDELGKTENVSWLVLQPRSKRHPLSRGDRRDNAVQALDAAIQALQGLEDADDKNDDRQNNIQALIGDLEQIKDEAEGVEFPGFG